MTKKTNKITNIILLCALLLSTGACSRFTNNFNLAMDLYNRKQYAQSVPFFEKAIKQDKNNLDAYYYYAKALTLAPMSIDTQKKLFEIANNKTAGAAATIANEKILKYRYFILTNTGENYIQQTPFDNKIIHWNPATFPLKVYIEQSKEIPPYYLAQAKKAFDSWTIATNNFIKFSFISEAEKADISLKFINQTTKCNKNNCHYTLATTEPIIKKGNVLKKMDIKLTKTTNKGESFTPEQVNIVLMHEIGHALGIMGHSFYDNNLMYPSYFEDTSIHARFHSKGISAQDFNTIKLLYSINPDITNKKYSHIESQNLIYAPIILGGKAERTSKKIEQAKQYIAQIPNLPNGYIDLASAYYELENYQECLNNLYLALIRTENEADKYPILYNMAITYFEARDYNNALNYAQMSANINNSSEIAALIGYLKYKLHNKEFGIEELKRVLNQNPNSIEAAQFLIRALIEEKKIIEAHTALKEFIKNNPDAIEDPRIKQFNLN